jgi:hypothetical protein
MTRPEDEGAQHETRGAPSHREYGDGDECEGECPPATDRVTADHSKGEICAGQEQGDRNETLKRSPRLRFDPRHPDVGINGGKIPALENAESNYQQYGQNG